MDEPLNHAQLLVLVQRLLNTDYDDEDEGNQLMETLQRQVSDPEVINYIFWPGREMTAEDILDRALSHRPIVLNWSPDQ